MIYTANQSLLFPCIYMMNRFANSDAIVLMGEAQFTKFGHQSRAEIITKQGRLTIMAPLQDRAFKPLNGVLVDSPKRWATKFLNTLQTVYGKRAGYKELIADLSTELNVLIERPNLTIFDLGVWSMSWTMRKCGIPTAMVRAEDMLGPRRPDWDASYWVARMGEIVGAHAYLGGGAAMKNYIRYSAFEGLGLDLYEQAFEMEAGYEAMDGKENTDATISILDLLMCEGSQTAAELIDTKYRVGARKKVGPEDCHSQ